MRKVLLLLIALTVVVVSCGKVNTQESLQTIDTVPVWPIEVKAASIDDSGSKIAEVAFLIKYDETQRFLAVVAENERIAEEAKAKAVAAAKKKAEAPKQTPSNNGGEVSGPAYVDGGSVWDRLAQCESGGNWHINTGNGYSGGLQFANRYWKAMGGSTDMPYQASREEQIRVAEHILSVQGYGAWPACSKKLGLR